MAGLDENSQATSGQNINNLFGLTERPSRSADFGSTLDNVETMIQALDSGSALNGFGPREAAAFGMGVDESASGQEGGPNALAQVMRFFTNSGDLAEARGARSNFNAAQFEEAANMLENQGQVSNFERVGAMAAVTNLSDADTTDDLARRELERVRTFALTGNHRQSNGISFDSNGFETLNGQNVVTYIDNEGNAAHRVVEEPTRMIPNWVTEDTARQMINSLPSGSRYVLNGQFFRRN